MNVAAGVELILLGLAFHVGGGLLFIFAVAVAFGIVKESKNLEMEHMIAAAVMWEIILLGVIYLGMFRAVRAGIRAVLR